MSKSIFEYIREFDVPYMTDPEDKIKRDLLSTALGEGTRTLPYKLHSEDHYCEITTTCTILVDNKYTRKIVIEITPEGELPMELLELITKHNYISN
jgi:hypothetical protein